MIPPTLESARAMRDGGIQAMSILNAALREAIVGLPAEQADELKHAFGRAMGEMIFELINPAVHAFPELTPDESEWAAIASAGKNW